MKLETKVTQYPEILSESGTYTIQHVKGPVETRFGHALIVTVTDSKKSETSLFVPYLAETSKKTNLARLIAALSSDTDKWIGKRIRVKIDPKGRRRIEPIARGG
ncbi:MAG: hypothetical protein ACHQ03_07875 [Candidatus Bathyarchaeia archaeon]